MLLIWVVTRTALFARLPLVTIFHSLGVTNKGERNVRKSTIYLYVLGLAVALMTAIASAGLVASAQNTNSSTTMAPETTKAKPKHRKPAATTGRCDPMQQEQTDLSGTYTGKLTRPDGTVIDDATLTITGNNFTATAGSDTHSGRITAVTTCGYTAVTMMTGDMTPPTPGPNPPPPNQAVSLRAKKVGDRITLTSVPGEPHKVSFVSAGAAKATGTHRGRRKSATKPSPPPPPEQ